MGNHNIGAVRFRQSADDFPLTVALGEKAPAFGLSRWGGKDNLRFIPLDDEGFSLRGNKRRLVYKGRRRSHRFTILGDKSFEYDCILEREPENNVISLVMEGAESFDFFRQPDFVADPFLKGSYAVYKKETLLGEGTGKLCHIHRPEIIDARGRRCWGDLSIVGNRLCITIPEQWLSEASYPVVVDPTVGTTTVGSQNRWAQEAGEPPEPLMFEYCIPVNRFLVSQAINGQCTAFFYINEDDREAGGRPVIYTDSNNRPLNRRSTNESFVFMRVNGSNPAGWRSGTFNTNGNVLSGSNIWLGLFCECCWMPRFDYGSVCYADWWLDDYDSIPNIYPSSRWSHNYNFKLSMYLTYSNAQNFVRTITQGVTLTDSRKLTVEYKRSVSQSVKTSATTTGLRTIYRKLEELVKGIDDYFFPLIFVRGIQDDSNVSDCLGFLRGFFRKIFDAATIESDIKHGKTLFVRITDRVQSVSNILRGLVFFVRIVTGLFIRDYLLSRFLKAKSDLVLKSCVCREITHESKIY